MRYRQAERQDFAPSKTYLLLAAGNLTGTCGEVLTTRVPPPGEAWLFRVSNSRMNFSASMGVASLGAEWAFAGPWSAKAEYMFARYDSENYFGGIAPPGVGFGMDVHTVKAGVNYRFGWASPVVAKY